MNLLTFCLVFVSMAATDFFWSLYIKTLAADKVIKAGIYGMAIMLCGSFTVINYTGNHWYLVPACLGGFVGTVLSKYVEKIKKNPTEQNNGNDIIENT